MMKHFLWIVLAVVMLQGCVNESVFIPAPAPCNSISPAQANDYFPLKDGNTWIYEPVKVDTTIQSISYQLTKGIDTYVMECRKNGIPFSQQVFESADTTSFLNSRIPLTGLRTRDSRVIYTIFYGVGSLFGPNYSFTREGKLVDFSCPSAETLSIALPTPAWAFESVIVCRFENLPQPPNFEFPYLGGDIRLWFAKYIGIVKYSINGKEFNLRTAIINGVYYGQ
jgi:hypothetical protein